MVGKDVTDAKVGTALANGGGVSEGKVGQPLDFTKDYWCSCQD